MNFLIYLLPVIGLISLVFMIAKWSNKQGRDAVENEYQKKIAENMVRKKLQEDKRDKKIEDSWDKNRTIYAESKRGFGVGDEL